MQIRIFAMILFLIAGSVFAGAGKGGGAGNGDGGRVAHEHLMDCDWMNDVVKVKCQRVEGCLPAEICPLISPIHEGEGTEGSPILVESVE